MTAHPADLPDRNLCHCGEPAAWLLVLGDWLDRWAACDAHIADGAHRLEDRREAGDPHVWLGRIQRVTLVIYETGKVRDANDDRPR
jgi:hypothetical protein